MGNSDAMEHEHPLTDSGSSDNLSAENDPPVQDPQLRSANSSLVNAVGPNFDSGTDDADNDDSSCEGENIPELLSSSSEEDTDNDTSGSEEDNLNYIR